MHAVFYTASAIIISITNVMIVRPTAKELSPEPPEGKPIK